MAVMKNRALLTGIRYGVGVNVLYPDANRVEEPDCEDIPVLYLYTGCLAIITVGSSEPT